MLRMLKKDCEVGENLGKTLYVEDYDEESVKKHKADVDESHRKDDTYEAYCWQKVMKPLIYMCITFGLLVVCAFFCIPCLLGIFVFSACTCPYIPAMNLPLWSAMIILIYHGWALTTGKLSLTWG